LDSQSGFGELPGLSRIVRERPTFVFNPAFGIKRLRALPDGRVFAEVRPTLLVPIEDVALSPDLARFLDLPVNREEISIISSFNETNPDSFAGLLDAGGERVQNFASILDARGNISLDAFRDRVVLVIGHIEDDSFILESAGNGKSASMPLSSMAEAARNSNTTVFYLGCNSFDVSQKTGFAAKVRDLEIFAGMRRALDARSYIDLAAAFGTIDNPFILTANSMNAEVGKAILTMQRLHKNEGLVAGGSYSLRLVANIEVVEAAYWEWLRVGGFWYALGLIAGLLQVGRVWALFARAFPVLPHLDLHPGRYYAGAVLRAVIFLVVSPVAVAFALFWILLSGGWSNRESVVYATFYGIFHPRDAVFTASVAGLYMLSFAAVGTVFLVGFVLIIGLDEAYWLTIGSLPAGGLLQLLIAVAQIILCIAIGLRAKNRFTAWVDVLFAGLVRCFAKLAALTRAGTSAPAEG